MPISILHLIGQMVRGGAERQLLYLTQALHERGWLQAVVTFNPGDIWEERLVRGGIRLLGIPRHGNKLWRLWQLGLIVRRERPTLIHSWTHHTNVYAHWLLSYPRPRLIVSFRGNPTVNNYTGRLMAGLPNRRVYAAADCVVSNSRVALDRARHAGVRMQRSEVVKNIVLARGQAKPGELVAVPRIVAAGALIPIKGYDVLLRALGQVDAEGQSFELLLAGEGSERPRLEELARKLGIGQRVRFLGEIEDVPTLLSTAHLLAHPSRSEGTSNTILEAMAEGLPVIATNVGGTPELISDEETGLLVPPDQPQPLAAKIRQLLVNPWLRERLGRAALDLVRERHSSGAVTSQYERIYKSMVMG